MISVLVLVLLLFLGISCETVNWKSGVSSLEITTDNNGFHLLSLSSTRFVQEDFKNYVLHFDYLENDEILQNETKCLGYHDSADDIVSLLPQLPFLADISIKRFGNGSNGWDNGYLIHINITSDEYSQVNVSVEANNPDCKPITTIGKWSDSSNWEGSTIPSEDDTAVLPHNAGVIIVDVDVTISALYASGGSLVLYTSTCGDNWTPSPDYKKCYQFFPYALTFSEAEKKCLSLDGSFRALSQVSSFKENQLVQNMCQDRGRGLGCWIGLTDVVQQGRFLWRTTAGIADTSFQSWHRFEPDNRTTLTGGEDCAFMLPFYEDPLQQARAQWGDAWCLEKKFFSCEKSGQFELHSLTVTTESSISNTNIIGSGSLRLESLSTFNGSISLTEGSQLYLLGESKWNTQTVVINGLSKINILGKMTVQNNSLFSELEIASPFESVEEWEEYRSEQFSLGAFNNVQGRGIIYVMNSGTLQFELFSNSWIDQQVIVEGSMVVHGDVKLAGGGSMSQASITLGSSSNLVLAESSVDSTQSELYELQVSSTKPIIGDYSKYAATEQDGDISGTFKLQVSWNGQTSTSYCIPYNVTATALKTALESIDDIQTLGGVTVTRLGDGTNYWKYGYKYRIEFDAVPVEEIKARLDDSAILSVSCQGIAGCGCTEVLSAVGLGCRGNSPARGQNTSIISSNQCTVRPSISMTRLMNGGYASIVSEDSKSGIYGAIHVTGGTHRLSPYIGASLNISKGALILTSDKISIDGGLTLSDKGWLVLAGTGYPGWNAANLMYSAANAKGRSSALLSYPPPVVVVMSTIEMDGGYLVATTADGSNVTASSLLWKGGVISGRSKLLITDQVDIQRSETKSFERQLRNSFTITVQENAVMDWTEGDIIFREGANIEIFGEINAFVTAGEQIGTKDSFNSLIVEVVDDGEAEDLYVHQFDEYVSLNQWEKSKQYSDEYWYSNPLCGSGCESEGKVVIRGNGKFSTNSDTFCVIAAPLFVLGKIFVDINASAELQGGGDSYGLVTILGKLKLSGNEFRFQAQSQTTGNGTIDVTGGSHRLPPIVAPTLRVFAGKVVNFNVLTSFLNGVVIEQDGILQFAIVGVNASVTGNLTMNGGTILFPEVNPMPALHPAHLTGDKRYSDRGKLLVYDFMHWRGGTVRGDAELHVETGMTIGGDKKYVQALAHIINKKNAIWESGDVISSEQGFFYNLGTLEIANADTFSSEMVYLDSFDGCCPYETHSMLIWA